MISRPCRTDSDLSRLWNLLLPGTPMPACGVAAGTGDAKPPTTEKPPADHAPPATGKG